MDRIRMSLMGAILVLSACATTGQAAGIAQAEAQTQVFQSSVSTALAGTMTALAPTATQIAPSPTPSGKFEIFNVAVQQVSANEAAVTFGFQIPDGVDPQGLMIGARPEGCDASPTTFNFVAYVPGSSASGIVSEPDSIKMHFMTPGKCEATGVTIFMFREGGAGLYSAKFDAVFTLEMK